MLRRLFVILFVVFDVQVAHSREIGFVEEFALAADRSEVLKQLIPGTEDYYFFHCLHLQNTEQFDRVGPLVEQWIKRHGRSERVRQIQHRQALLTYPWGAPHTLSYLRGELRLRFDHQRERVDHKGTLPTRLDPTLLDRERLAGHAFQRHVNLDGFSDAALEWLIATDLDPLRRRHLLERLVRPDHSRLPQLVIDDLNYKDSRGFGSLPIHAQLLTDQLDTCLKLKPDLLHEMEFVGTYISKLHPNDDVDWRSDPEATQAYLDRLWSFVGQLDANFNSLKANVLYHRLAWDRSRGSYDKARLLEYLKLPRHLPYVSPKLLQAPSSRRYPADVNYDGGAITLLPPIDNDEAVVRDYLMHFLRDAPNYDEFEPYVNDVYLKHLFAETKIVSGLGDPEQWYSLLPPEAYQALRDRVDIDFAPTNQQIFSGTDPVELDLFIKNVESLLVRIYEINAKNYYRQNLREVNTDVNLDGLVPNSEQTYGYDDPPLARVAHRFRFPQIQAPGIYVVDFIGNGKSSRAVIRKGTLRVLNRISTAGHVFTVYDEGSRPLHGATLWMAGHEYAADKQGRITVPFSTDPGQQPIVVSHQGLSVLTRFDHLGEDYQLVGAFHVDRQALRTHQTADLLVRASLQQNGVPVTLSLLKNVKLVLTSVDQDGVETTKEVSDFELFEDRESVFPFQVPPRLAQLHFALHASVPGLSQNQDIDVSAEHTLAVNGVDRSDKIEDMHLARSEEGYVLELRGKSGEPRPDRPVHFRLQHRDFTEPVEVTLQTDPGGQIELGELGDILTLSATAPDGTQHTWPLTVDRCQYYHTIHGSSSQPLRIPFVGLAGKGISRRDVSLLERRQGTFSADRFSALSLQDGFLNIAGLAPGDYDLLLKRDQTRIQIRITEGESVGGFVIGRHRQLERRNPQPLHIANIEPRDEQLIINIKNTSPHTRVHVFATRYLPAFSLFEDLGIPDAEPRAMITPAMPSLFIAGRDIGDEYRYIIERKSAPRYPGIMLSRPGLLLAPWAIRTTETGQQTAAEGEEFGVVPQAGPAEELDRAGPSRTPVSEGDFANLDFLPDGSAALLNLRPDAQGKVLVDRKDLAFNQQVHVVAIDPLSTIYRSVALPAKEFAGLDLRLLTGLDTAVHFTRQKQVTILSAKQTLLLSDTSSSEFDYYDTIGRVYGLFMTLSNDARLARFSFVPKWADLKEEEKREKFSQFACHELNFFLYQKDPEFFRSVVRPFLANKKDKTFLDRWLVDEDLESYLSPWNYERLNIAERILLGKRMENELAHMQRHVSDLFQLVPKDVNRWNHLFRTAVRGQALDVGQKFVQMGVPVQDVKNGAILGKRSEPLAGRRGDAAGQGVEKLGRLAARSEAPEERGRGRAVSENLGEAVQAAAGEQRDEQLYRKLDKTQEWVENNYFELPQDQQNANLVTVNAFWQDYAGHPAGQPFLSRHWPEASHNFSEMMFALSFLDLPFRAGDHKPQFDGARMTLKAAGPVIAFHEEILPADKVLDPQPILVSQNFFQHGDRYQQVEGERQDKFVTDEFLVHTVYGCQVVVTNPGSTPQKLNLLLQIPEGAVPVQNGHYTRSVELDLEPYHTQTVEYFFYFPTAGDFPHYPVHVAREGTILAHAPAITLHVVDEPTRVDRQSWNFVSQFGTDEEVLSFLREHNVQELDLARVAFRMRDKRFFHQVLDLLGERHAYDHTLWSYGVFHDDPPVIREFLQHADAFVAQCGAYLDSPLLTIDPVARTIYEHMEYRPLVNARTHRLGKKRQMVNERLYDQYHRFMDVLSRRRELTDNDWLAVAYYLALQDRLDETLAAFANVHPERVESQLQFEYFAAYLDCLNPEPELARSIVEKYANYPVERWRKAFLEVKALLDEVQGGEVNVVDPKDRTQVQTQLAARQPTFDLRVEANQVHLDYQHLRQVAVNYYLMDLELLFSQNPFVNQFSNQFAHIRPNASQSVDLPGGQARFSFDLPEQFRNRNVLVEVSAAGVTKAVPYYANSLAVQVVDTYGQLSVRHAATHKPLPAVYVKVYAELEGGQVQFYKDGYTDLRGRFDYSSLNTNELDYVKRFSLLVMSDDHGAVVREANPPKR
jgi:hypothetical protein